MIHRVKSFLVRVAAFTIALAVLFPIIPIHAAPFLNCEEIEDPTEKQKCKEQRALYLESHITQYCSDDSANPLVINVDVEVAGGDATEKVWNGLISAGFTPEQAAGIMGNMQSESAFNPGRHENKFLNNSKYDSFEYTTQTHFNGDKISYGVGLIQWSGGRRVNFFTAIRTGAPDLLPYVTDRSKGGFGAGDGNSFIAKVIEKLRAEHAEKNEDEITLMANEVVNSLIAVELQFLRHEIETTNSYKKVLDATSVEEAAWLFLVKVEIPGGITSSTTLEQAKASRPERFTAAAKFYELYAGGGDSGDGGGGSSGSSGSGNYSYSMPGQSGCIAAGGRSSNSSSGGSDPSDPDSGSSSGGGGGSSSACGPSNIAAGSLPIRNIDGRSYTFPLPNGRIGTGTHGGRDAVDIHADECTPVYAITSGTVVHTTSKTNGADKWTYCPNTKFARDTIFLKTGSGVYMYTHLVPFSTSSILRHGQSVQVGDFLGNIGDSNTAGGHGTACAASTPHLHIEYNTGNSFSGNQQGTRVRTLLNQLQ